jgi:RHH-type rel operon transcriptional repressor/antitoxin RelB
MLTIELDDELSNAIEKLAEQGHVTAKQLIHDALVEWLEDIQDVHAAEAAIARIESGESKLVDWADVKDGLYGLEG